MKELKGNRLVSAFSDLRAAGKKALVPFITAGYPDLETTEALLRDFESRGVRICELGIPFSDPIADGPVIQASYTEALAAGITSDRIFEMVRRYRGSMSRDGSTGSPQGGSSGLTAGRKGAGAVSRDRKGAGAVSRDRKGAGGLGQMALVAMVSYSIIYRHGVEDYLAATREAGFDGLIVPDLPLEEAAQFEQLAAGNGLANVMLMAPTTPPQRRLRIAGHSKGFIYFISVAGITGERAKLPEESIAAVAELRKHTSTPICIGFGISNPATVRHVCEVADGAIVGSAIVHRVTDAKDMPREKLVGRVGDFVSELLAPIA